MKKWLSIGLLSLVAIVTFIFFTPVFILLFGLCCVLFGMFSVIRPSQVQKRRAQRTSRIRGMGVVFCIVGLATSALGGFLAKDFYQGDSSNTIASNFSFEDTPKSNGSDVSRPETEEEQPKPETTHKVVEKKESTTTSTTPTPVNSSDNTSTTSPSTTSSTPVPTSQTSNTTTKSSTDTTTHPGKSLGLEKGKKTR